MMRLKQDTSLGENLYRLRKMHGYSQERLTAQMQLYGCAISREIYSQMERGVHGLPISDLLVLSEIYNCPVEEFFLNLPIPQKCADFYPG